MALNDMAQNNTMDEIDSREIELFEIADAAEAEGDFDTAIEAYQMIEQLRAESPYKLYDQIDRAIAQGNFPAELAAREKLQERGMPRTDPRGGQIEQVVEPVLTGGSAIGAEVIGGLAGTAQALNPFAPEGAGTDTLEQMREKFTYIPKTEAGQEGLRRVGHALEPITEATEAVETTAGDIGYKIGEALEMALPPTLRDQIKLAEVTGTIGEVTPTLLMELGGLILGRAAQKGAQQASSLVERGIEAESAKLGEIQTEQAALMEGPIRQEGLEALSERMKSGDYREIAELLQADPEFYAAADRLEMTTEPLASFASRNPQFRGLEQGLTAIPGSELNAESVSFIQELSQKADNIIEEYGTLDRSELSQDFKNNSLQTISDIYDSENKIYKVIDEQIPSKTRIEASNTLNFLNEKIEDLGGFKNLPGSLKRLYKEISPSTKKGETKIGPTYGFLNRERKLVGERLFKKTGGADEFKKLETGELKQLYSVLKEDQNQTISKYPDLENLQKSADTHTIKRKSIEENLSNLLGSELQKEIVPEVGKAMTKLPKEGVQQWKNMMAELPDKTVREKIVVSALNDIMKGRGSGQEALGTNQFTKFMTQINRQPSLKKVLYDELPRRTQEGLDDLYKVTRGVDAALKDKIKTGIVSP